MKGNDIAALLEKALGPVITTLADIQIATILACHARNAIDIEALREVLDLAASDSSERPMSRAIVERVVAALPPRPR